MHYFRMLGVAGVLAAFAVPSYAVAQVESTPIPAAKKPNFAPISFLLGTWSCSTKSARRAAPYITTTTYTADSSGYWIDETSTTNPTKWIPTKLTTHDKITYDSDTHRWVDVLYGDYGTYGLSFSTGWNGDKLVWHDVSFAAGPDIKSQTDTTVTKVSATKMTTSSSFTEANGGRVVSVKGVCTKQ